MPLTDPELRLSRGIAKRAEALLGDLRTHVNLPTGPRGTGLDETRERFTTRLAALGAKTSLIPGEPKEDWLRSPGEPSEIPPTAVCRRSVGDLPSVLLCGHLDTVHDAASPFRALTISADGKTATGPGCVDMKGGLVIALHALEALEEAGIRASWGFIFNSDEETGSYHSDAALRAEAPGYAAGLVFEPAMTDGGLVIQRPGSGQFMIEARGKAGHVGRDFKSSVSAVTALARAIVSADALADADRGRILSIGPLQGGTATNIVPDHAVAWGNVRFDTPEIAEDLGRGLDILATSPDALPGLTVRRSFHRPAKPTTPAVQSLALLARSVAEDLGQTLPFGRTGGVCDGNNLQAAGLPTIDTLGVRGGGLHTTSEWIELPSLVERCQLTAILIARLCAGGAA